MLTQLHFCAIGFGYVVCANKVYMLLTTKAKQSQRMLRAAKKEGRWIDVSCRRPVKSLIIMDDNRIIGCPFTTKTVYARLMRACGNITTQIPPDEDAELNEAEDEDEEENESAEEDEE